MADPIFYVGSEDKKFTSFVPAKFLMRNGSYVTDPTPGGSQNAYLYSNIRGGNKTDGRTANPNNYLIVPANYSERQAREFADQIARIGCGISACNIVDSRLAQAYEIPIDRVPVLF